MKFGDIEFRCEESVFVALQALLEEVLDDKRSRGVSYFCPELNDKDIRLCIFVVGVFVVEKELGKDCEGNYVDREAVLCAVLENKGRYECLACEFL